MTVTQVETPFQVVDISKLKMHPKNVEIYGDEDVTALKQSIAESGWIKPLTVTPEHVIISGHRRYRAALELGYTELAVEFETFASEEAEMERLLRENENRGKTPEQQIREGLTWEPIEEKKATVRWGNQFASSKNLLQAESGQTRDIIARRVGLGSGVTYEKGKEVVKRLDEAFARYDEKEGDLIRVTLNDQSISAAHKLVLHLQQMDEERERKLAEQQRKFEALKAQVTELPTNKYKCIVIDPPWQMQKIERDVRPNQIGFDYPTMDEEQLKSFPVPDMAADDCHLYLWTTQKHLPLALRLAEHWGFKYQCLLTWRKNVGFTPFSWMYSTEHILFCRKGDLPLQKLGVRLDFEGVGFEAKVREHSRKPDEFYDIVKEVSSEPRIDVFSREKRDGFEQYGNEVEKFV